MKNLRIIIISLLFLTFAPQHIQAQIKSAPAQLTAAFIIKLAAFEKNLSGSEKDITIYVMGAPKVAKEFKKGIGKKIGKATLKNVVEGKRLPNTDPSILYVGNSSKLKEALKYTRSNKILSVTGVPKLVKEGVTLGIGIGKDGKPEIFLNLASSAEEELNWNPAIMKVAKIIK
ncbi:MAG: YfiR/HmsC family protein [Calditrichales bacterium]|nr:YfiR/HmsC family protein [Calditrichales bacterium]